MKSTTQINTVTVCDIQFRNNVKIFFFDPAKLTVRTGDEVIVDTSRGPELGHCVRGNHPVAEREVVAPLRPVVRIATAQDKKIMEENRSREKRAFEICQQKIDELKLDMQLVSTEYAFDGSKILFFFTADGRVDFRELVKSLASVLHTRIELRQIGVRDKAKMVGGLGICGRPFCCGEFLDDFQPVSIKMAKTQNLSLNPTKISGTCGRLMCCLNYEQEAYEDLLRTSPKAESFVDTPDGRGTVTDVNLLKQSAHVRLEKQPDTIVCHKNCDICVLRNGKAKKTDEPIPDDLAPISGNRPQKKTETPAFSTYLEPVVMKKTAETIAPASSILEKPEAAVESAANEQQAKHRRRRRGGKGKPETPVEAKTDTGKTAAPAKEAVKEADNAQKTKSAHHHRYHRRRKPGNKAE
ncbi:MAG: hypothetical protein CW335_06870 [Clostridiales bacterium]|nr:hypothetical protein [Clostridiales bacterium]